ncbi:hypothetical protein G6F56_009578 [Rhizopus delemar]|nr:hypothetical protein G6F56_009578 [Rhizopus delemar]
MPAIKRRARMALSCQRCRKHRSKCSRTRPTCEQCTIANVHCVYLEVPGDLESTALRDRFAGLENQIHSVIQEFGRLEHILQEPNLPVIRTNSLSRWKIYHSEAGLSVDTHMVHVSELYSALAQFSRENATTLEYLPAPAKKPVWLTRNHSIFPHVRLSHFTSIRPNVHDEDDDEYTTPDLFESDETEDEFIPDPVPTALVKRLLTLYKTCLLYGAVEPFDTLFYLILSETHHTCLSPAFQLLYASIICHMLPHAFYWHPEIFENSLDEPSCLALSSQYYRWAKRLLSSIYFDLPCLMTCHAICNLVLYHIENGNTSVVYLYSGMAVRMALSLQLYREDALDAIAETQASMFPLDKQPRIHILKEYARSLLWFMYFLDTASSHYHNKPYEIHLDDHVSTTTYFRQGLVNRQAFFQWTEFHTCQITRDIRRTIFTHPEEAQTSYEAIERIEQRLIEFQKRLPTLADVASTDSVWYRRSAYKQWIRNHGHWILIHQSYLPTPMSVQRCTVAAFALVELFDAWVVQIDCYFRPCVHELKQACEILLYHVDQETPIKAKALEGLVRLINVLLRTPVGEIARSRPFVQRVLKAIQKNNTSLT